MLASSNLADHGAVKSRLLAIPQKATRQELEPIAAPGTKVILLWKYFLLRGAVMNGSAPDQNQLL
jgi:hypothetical protein